MNVEAHVSRLRARVSLAALAAGAVLGLSGAAQASLCDFKACTTGTDCILGVTPNLGLCQDETCVDLSCSADDNGGAGCATDDDCTSHACQNSLCAPQGLIGIAEIQLAVASPGFQDLIIGTAVSQKDDNLCAADSMPFPCFVNGAPSTDGTSCLLSGITFIGQALVRRGPVGSVQTPTIPSTTVASALPELLIPMQISQQEDCTTDPMSCSAPSTLISGFLVEQISAELASGTGNILLCTTLTGYTPALVIPALPVPSGLTLPPALTQKNCQDLGQSLGGALTSLGFTPEDIQVATDADPSSVFAPASRLAIRLWAPDHLWHGNENSPTIEPALLPTTYSTFFGTSASHTVELAPAPANSDWSMFVGYSALGAVGQSKIIDAATPVLQNLAPDVTLTADGRSWAPSPAAVGFSLNGLGDVTVEGITCTAQIEMPCTLTLTGPTIAGIALDATCDPSATVFSSGNGDSGVCDVVPPSLVTALFDQKVLNALQGLQLFKGAACTTDPSSIAVHCTLPSSVGAFQLFADGPTLGLTIDELSGVQQGVMLGGAFTSTGLTPQTPGITVTVRPFEQGVLPTSPDASPGLPDPCNPSAEIYGWWAWIDVSGTGDYCDTTLIDNINNFWSVVTVYSDAGGTRLPVHVLVSPVAPGADATQAPDDFHGQVLTTDGSAFVTIPKPPKSAMTPAATLTQLIADVGAAASECNLEGQGFLGVVGVYDPRWAIDPSISLVETLVNLNGASIPATVTVLGTSFALQGAPLIGRQDDHAFGLHGQSLVMTGTLLVQPSGAPPFVVPFSIPFSADLTGDFVPSISDDYSILQPSAPLDLQVSVTGDALPVGFGALSLHFTIPAGDLTLYGLLGAMNPNCVDASDHTAATADRQSLTCADPGTFSLAQAFTACGGPVNYYSYACSDYPASPPDQTDDERAWTAYYGCCAAPDGTGGAGGSGG